MSRSAVFYVVKAMERTVAGAGAPPARAGQAVDREAGAARPGGSTSALVRRMLAAVRHSIGGAAGATSRGRRPLGGTVRAD